MEIKAVGHAGYGPLGKDIVCAGVSALLYGYLAYLQRMVKESGEGQVCQEEEEGKLWVRSRGLLARDVQAFAVIFEGLCMIAEAYPRWLTLQVTDEVTHTPTKEEESIWMRS